MIRWSLYRAVTVAAVTAVFATGCNSNGCIDNQSALPLAGFYDYATLAPKTLQNVEIGAVDAPNDSLLVENKAVSTSYLPFNIGADQTVFFIRYKGYGLDDPAMFDTLRFKYERIPYYASEDCGVMFKYDIKEFVSTYHRIDSVALPYSVITNVEVQSIEIYFADLTPLPRPENPDIPDVPENPDDNNDDPDKPDENED